VLVSVNFGSFLGQFRAVFKNSIQRQIKRQKGKISPILVTLLATVNKNLIWILRKQVPKNDTMSPKSILPEL
jgi:hypothetical protein